LSAQYEDVSKKLERAKLLISSLGGEKDRWQKFGIKFEKDYVNLTGDVLISSGIIVYLGAFTAAFRNQITDEWAEKTKAKQIPSSETLTLQTVLGDPVLIRSLNI
jgi:dynein heavy chain